MTWRDLPGAGMGPTPDNMNKCCLHTELSSHEGTRSEFNPGRVAIKLGIDVHQEFYVVVVQEGGTNPKPAQRFKKEGFLPWAAQLKEKSGAAVYAVYEACGFGFGLQRALSALEVPEWMKELLGNSQPILLALEEKIRALTIQLQARAAPGQPRGLGAMTSVVIDREIGNWNRFSNRRQVGSYTGLCPGEYSSGNTRVQSCVTKHGNPRLRAALVELAWRLVRFQPSYKPVLKWRAILAKGALATGAARKKAIVAVARQLAVDLWRVRTGRCKPEALGLEI